jgi:creatinine amidohydrolase
MILANATWHDVRDFDKKAVCLIPTGSLEQHGPHLPLFTDTLLSSYVAKEAEQLKPNITLLFPAIWLGCSLHHMAMSGTLSASSETYQLVLKDVVESAISHGFSNFLILNGHGGNAAPNEVAMRDLKHKYPHHVFAFSSYFSLIPSEKTAELMTGPVKHIRHACEAETSMMLYLYPDLVREDCLKDDGLTMDPPIPSGLNLIQPFDEITEDGSWGFSTEASAGKGEKFITLAVECTAKAIEHLYNGYVMRSY